MIEVIKQFFGGSLSAVEAFCGSMSLGAIITMVISVFYNTYKGKKTKKEIESVKAENQEIINKFIEAHKQELDALKDNLTKNIDNICNMLLLELKKSGFDMETINAVIDLYKKTATNELLDTDKLQEEKEQEIAQEQTTQEQVNENLKNIDALNDLV